MPVGKGTSSQEMSTSRKLISHSKSSCLYEHTREVALAGKERWETIAILCHDIGKACKPWQDYAYLGFPEDHQHPNHALAGGIIAYSLIKPSDQIQAITAYHALCAHHTQLGNQSSLLQSESFQQIIKDIRAKQFTEEILEGYYLKSEINETWSIIQEKTNKSGLVSVLADIQKDIRELNPAERIKTTHKARSLLGRLVIFDHASANKQAKNLERFIKPIQPKLPNTFRKKIEKGGEGELNRIRTELTKKTLELPFSRIYLIEAPTGTGKTEAMLQLAERDKPQMIVYAVPQTSIGDQIVLDYLQGQKDENGEPLSQIWNYRRREKIRDKEEENDGEELSSKEVFSSKYNVTTFNQVALALLHPHREYCARSTSLHNCTIILDEIHKMPLATLKALLEITNPENSDRNITWIFGSATPPPLTQEWIGPHQITTLPEEFIEELKSNQTIQNRRVYYKEGQKNAEAVAKEIIEYAERGASALYMINLIDRGTAHVAQILGINPEPWKREIRIANTPIFWLDSTVPQHYRKELIQKIKAENPRDNPCILLCTAIIQAGVDLDFQEGKADEDSIASLIQTAGRVGRNGDKTRKISVFSFITEKGDTTKKVIQHFKQFGIQGTGSTENPSPLKDEISRYERKIQTEEQLAFDTWEGEKSEKELLIQQNAIQRNALKYRKFDIPNTLEPKSNPDLCGLSMEDWHELSTIYPEMEKGKLCILLEEYPDIPQGKKDKKNWLNKYSKSHGCTLGERMRNILSSKMTALEFDVNTEIWYPQTNII